MDRGNKGSSIGRHGCDFRATLRKVSPKNLIFSRLKILKNDPLSKNLASLMREILKNGLITDILRGASRNISPNT